MDPIIELKNVNFWYDRGKPTEMWALHNISLQVQKGEYIAFFGPSGSGKTTLLYLLSGTEMSQDGQIIVNGKDVATLSKAELAIYRQMAVGMVFQQFNLIPNLTVAENVALPMAFLGISTDKRTKEAMRLLERLNIGHMAKKYPYELSGGQQQRVGIARALANNAPIIIADEPIGNLDSANANNALDFLKELQEKDGKTVIMVTHEAWSLRDAKKIFYLKDGVIEKVEEGRAGVKPAAALSEKLYKQLVPGQSKQEVAALVMTNLLFRGYSGEETRRFNDFLYKRLIGQFDQSQFFAALHSPYREGGGGLWQARALQISRYVEGIIQEHMALEEIVTKLEMNPATPISHDVDLVIEWLMQGRPVNLDQMQTERLREAIEDVLRNAFDIEAFKKVLYLPKSQLGVGLSHRATENFYDKFKMALGSFELDALKGGEAQGM